MCDEQEQGGYAYGRLYDLCQRWLGQGLLLVRREHLFLLLAMILIMKSEGDLGLIENILSIMASSLHLLPYLLQKREDEG